MAGTALRERPISSPLLDIHTSEEPQTMLTESSETLAFSALLREVLGDLRKDPAFLTLKGQADDRAASSLEPAA
jgi:hypothetical protein